MSSSHWRLLDCFKCTNTGVWACAQRKVRYNVHRHVCSVNTHGQVSMSKNTTWAKRESLCESRMDPESGNVCAWSRMYAHFYVTVWCFFGPVPLEHPMKVHNPVVRWSSCPITEGPRVPWRSLGVSGKGTYPNVNGIVNITEMSLPYFPFLSDFSSFYNKHMVLNVICIFTYIITLYKICRYNI